MMDGLYFDQLPPEIQEAFSAEAGAKAEEEGLQKNYGELMSSYEAMQERNEEFKRFYCTRPDENIGDI